MSPYQSNLRKLYAIQVFNGFVFTVPVFYSILYNLGLGSTELFILQAVYAIAVVLFEIPTGFFGDKYGRKISMTIGGISYVLAYLVYFFASWFWWFLWGEIIIAFAASCISGCDKAMLYDSLIELKKEGNYKKFSWIMSSLSSFAEATGAIISGIVASYWLQLPFLMDASMLFLWFRIILTLKEPPIERFDHHEASRKQLKQVYHYIIHGHDFLWRLLLLGGFMSATSLSLVRVTQPYMQHIGLSVLWIGITRSVLNLLVALFHLIAHRYEARLWPKKTFLSLITLRSITIMIAGFLWNIWWLICFGIFAFVRAGQRTVIEDMMQTAVISKMRATIASAQSMFFRFSFVLLWPILGRITDRRGIQDALYIFGITTWIVCLLFFQQFWKRFTKRVILSEV